MQEVVIYFELKTNYYRLILKMATNYQPLSDSGSQTEPLNTDQAITKVGGGGLYQCLAGLILVFTFTLSG